MSTQTQNTTRPRINSLRHINNEFIIGEKGIIIGEKGIIIEKNISSYESVITNLVKRKCNID